MRVRLFDGLLPAEDGTFRICVPDLNDFEFDCLGLFIVVLIVRLRVLTAG